MADLLADLPLGIFCCNTFIERILPLFYCEFNTEFSLLLADLAWRIIGLLSHPIWTHFFFKPPWGGAGGAEAPLRPLPREPLNRNARQ